MASRVKKPKLKLRGISRFTRTDRAYSFSQELKKTVPDEDGKISTDVVLSAERAAPIIAALRAYAKEEGVKNIDNLKNLPYSNELDKETEEPTGNIVFKTWQYGKDQDGKVRKMGHYDSKGKPLVNFRLTSGSEIITQVRPSYYKGLGGGICLYLDAIQVVKYREFESNPFEALDEDEDGYVADASDDDVADEGDSDDGEETSTDF